MSGTIDQLKVVELNEALQKFGDGWNIYGNEPNHPFTIVANDNLKIVTQIFNKNHDLKKWMRKSWYHPKYTNDELEAKSNRTNHTGLFKTVDILPSFKDQQRWYKEYVEVRKKI